MAKVIIVGPAHPLRGGGMATFNHRLAYAFQDAGHDVSIYSFSLQYPSFLFPGTSQFTDEPAPEGLHIKTLINSINPINWVLTGKKLNAEKADLVIVRYWLPFMGPALGTILRQVDRKRTRIIAIVDNAIPHERRIGDRPFTSYFLKPCDGFVTMSDQVFNDLKTFNTAHKPSVTIPHPLYDNFGAKLSKQAARDYLGIEPNAQVILFFGFIRKYKGLDMLLEAFAKFRANTQNQNFKLLIAGEFYEDEEAYKKQIEDLGIASDLILKTNFIPDREVRYYLSAADVLAQPYRNATQSGVTPLAYNFEVPMVVTNVGGLPDLVPHEQTGVVTAPNPDAIANGLKRFFELGAEHFVPHLKEERKKLSWEHFIAAVLELAKIKN